MKGMAPPESFTGKIQRALGNDWRAEADIIFTAHVEMTPYATTRACLVRLEREGRAESRFRRSSDSMSGGWTEWRRKAD